MVEVGSEIVAKRLSRWLYAARRFYFWKIYFFKICLQGQFYYFMGSGRGANIVYETLWVQIYRDNYHMLFPEINVTFPLSETFIVFENTVVKGGVDPWKHTIKIQFRRKRGCYAKYVKQLRMRYYQCFSLRLLLAKANCWERTTATVVFCLLLRTAVITGKP